MYLVIFNFSPFIFDQFVSLCIIITSTLPSDVLSHHSDLHCGIMGKLPLYSARIRQLFLINDNEPESVKSRSEKQYISN